MIDHALAALVQYGFNCSLLEPGDETYAINRLLEIMDKHDYCAPEQIPQWPLEEILTRLLDDAVSRGVCGNTIAERDLFDTKLMGALTPFPSTIRKEFSLRYVRDPQAATDWFYTFSQDTDYIRRYRVKKDLKWQKDTPYGKLDITINRSKPEKDPLAVAAAKLAPQSGYPRCALCPENEGYAGRLNHPARQNHRIIPIVLGGEAWYFQYSPYVYYNEHCIALNSMHTPMKIEEATFRKLLDFVEIFPHYFIGSNADLPIVGGSILAHEHFQGGHYHFAMEKAPIECPVSFSGFESVEGGILKWPMSVIRLRSENTEQLVSLGGRILSAWRGYSDEQAFIFAETNEEVHNTITPIARKRDNQFELDLVLRNNYMTAEHPLGVYHPHQELHHIKQENIGLIEVMGLAVLPARLQKELSDLAAVLVNREKSLDMYPDLAKHSRWAEELRSKYTFTKENVMEILQNEVGAIFLKCLEHAGVYKCTDDGRAAFHRFIESI